MDGCAIIVQGVQWCTGGWALLRPTLAGFQTPSPHPPQPPTHTTLHHPPTLSPAGLAASFQHLYDAANKVAANIAQTKALLHVVGTEWNAYSTCERLPHVWRGGGGFACGVRNACSTCACLPACHGLLSSICLLQAVFQCRVLRALMLCPSAWQQALGCSGQHLVPAQPSPAPLCSAATFPHSTPTTLSPSALPLCSSAGTSLLCLQHMYSQKRPLNCWPTSPAPTCPP